MLKSKKSLSSPIDRRELMIASALIGSSLFASSAARAVGKSARLRLASIGVGGMGGSDLGQLSAHQNVEIVALCDVDKNNLAAASERHPKAKTYSDYRKMFSEMEGSIDAVNVATPDHTHAPAAMSALNLNKHVYCQKPLTHDIYEARQLNLEAAKRGVSTQMGTQIHSASPYRTAVKLIQSGVVGKILEAHSWSNKTWGYDGGMPETTPIPESLDWDLWLGTAPARPFSAGQYHPGNWRRWYDFGCGTMGDMAIHILDPVFSALKLSHLRSVHSESSAAPKYSYGLKNHTRFLFAPTPFTTSDFKLTWSDGGMMPQTNQWPIPIVDGKETSLPDQGSIFIGEKGAVLLPHVAMPVLWPADQFRDYEINVAPDGNHYHLWVDACLGGEPTTAHFGYAGPLTEAVLLGTLANRFPGETMQWDSNSMKIVNHDQANKLVRRTYRPGFEIENL